MLPESDEGTKDLEKEEKQNGIPKEEKAKGKKRAASPEGLLKPVKLGKGELYKVPTNEELSHLKETENLFHSNLLRLQIEELLKEVTLKEKRKQRIEAFLHEIRTLLNNVPEVPAREITDQSWLPTGVKVPILQLPFKVKGKFHFLPPVEVNVVGSYLLGTCIKPDVNVDVAVIMPKEAFQEKDNLNQRYHRKRALYLAHLAQHLAETNRFGSVAFGYQNGNHLKPVVLLQPQGKLGGGRGRILRTCGGSRQRRGFAVQFEARQSMEILDDKRVDGFQLLFMTQKPLVRTFDHVFHLRHVSKLQTACKKMQLLNALMDRGGNYVAAVLPFFLSLLERGLARRVALLAHQLPQTQPWSIHQDPPKHKDISSLSFGLLLNLDFANSVLERGPEADQDEFRQFWGERSELRRFQDGVICEAVLWDAANLCQKRLIPEQIIRHILKLHLDIPETSISYVGALLEPLIKLGHEPAGTGEEEMVGLIRSYDDLSRKLWHLEGMPLTVTAVQGAHPALRYTETFPPVPVKPDYTFHGKIKDRASFLPMAGKPCPAFVAPIKVICQMEGSGQWPRNKEAIQCIKAAFQMQLAEVLNQQHHLLCRPTATYTDIHKVILPPFLPSIPPSLPSIHPSLLTSSFPLLQQQYPAFSGSCRLAKRWINAQLLSDSLTEEAVDLLAVFLFLSPAPFTAPSSPQVGFLRFLHLLATFDWKNSPLLVNLNGDLKEADYVAVRNHFMEARPRLPAMFIATPKDQKQSVWTREKPSPQILQRLLVLAQEALQVLDKQLMDPLGTQDVKMAFRPPLDLYDVLIHLNPKQVPRHLEAVDRPTASFYRGMLKSSSSAKTISFPVVDYDPVQCYLEELREAFSDFALFFYDKYGGVVIGVLWKPSAFEPQPFKVSVQLLRCD
uniref:Nucleolar protein 6 n=1 Tax=Pseudonaja textilis TaxID=8673 RepID=A0A670Z235_PSETE